MKLEPHGQTNFGRSASVYVYKRTKTHVSFITNKVSFIGIKTHTIEEFNGWYEPRPLSDVTLDRMLQQMKGYAIKVGLSTEAGEVLPKLVKMTKEELNAALAKGKMTESKIAAAAAKEMEQMMASGGAPRKLYGAAAKSAADKAARLAAEAKELATGPATEELKADEAAGKDVRLKPASKRKPAKIEATTPKKKEANKVLKDVAAKAEGKPTRADKNAKGFDVTKMKKADGSWRSASSMFKGLIFENPGRSDEDIFKDVQKQFGLDDDKLSYVKWNRGWFEREGIQLG